MGKISLRLGGFFSLFCFTFALVCGGTLSAWAEQDTASTALAQAALSDEAIQEIQKDQLGGLHAIVQEVKTHYGMAKYKEEQFGVRLADLEAKYSQLILKAQLLEEAAGLVPTQKRLVLSQAEFQQLMIGFAAEFKDGHFNILRNSRESWTVGLRTAAIDNRLYVTGFNSSLFDPATVYPRLQMGDEIVKVNGVSVQDLAKRNELYLQLATPASLRQRALEMVLNVSGRWMLPKPSANPVQVEFRRGVQTIVGNFHWLPTKDLEDLSGLSRYLMPDPTEPEKRMAAVAEDLPYIYGQSGTTRTYWSEGLKNLDMPLGAVTDIGLLLNVQIVKEREKKKAKSPSTDKELAAMQPVSRLAAYTVKVEDRTLGVIRLPSYSPEGGFMAAVNELNWLARVIGMFENTTDGLIIDQLGNGGGYVYQFSHLLRLFAHDGEIPTQMIDIKLTETFFNSNERVAHPLEVPNPQFEGARRPYSRVYMEQALMAHLRAQFDAGQKWSGFVGYGSTGVDLFPETMGTAVGMPGKVYSKPIVILNDSRSASGGDFFPAAMQSAGRAIVMGERSMGLGGPVYRNTPVMPGSEMFMRCTMGFCLRGDGLPIENLGAVPDVVRPVQHSDLMDGFTRYASEVLNVAANLAAGAELKDLRSLLGRIQARRKPVTEPLPSVEQLEKALAKADKDAVAVKAAYAAFLPAMAADLKAIVQKAQANKGATLRMPRTALPLPQALLSQDLLLTAEETAHGLVERLQTLKKLGRLTPEWQEVADLIMQIIVQAKDLVSARRDVCADILVGFKNQRK